MHSTEHFYVLPVPYAPTSLHAIVRLVDGVRQDGDAGRERGGRGRGAIIRPPAPPNDPPVLQVMMAPPTYTPGLGKFVPSPGA